MFYRDFNSTAIFIINKKALAKCLKEFEPLFRENLREDFTLEWFISELEIGVPLTTIIQDNEMLFGILLGYGEESSRAFKEAQDNYKGNFAPDWTETYCGIEAKQPLGCKIGSVSFMGNPKSGKTQKLLSEYASELQTIWNNYQKKNDALLFFLEHLCRERS